MEGSKAFSNLPPFSFAGVELNDRRQKWHTWKRGFEICLRAAKIKEANEKKDILLAQGGFELQEIFFNIPGADVVADKEKNIDPYNVAISKLDDYFAPQRHEAHERYIFWAMKPEQGETLAKFIMRTQVHASKCDFGKTASESAQKAVVDKMLQFAPVDLREKLLREVDLTLEEAIKQVNAYETSRAASEQISGQSAHHQPPRTEYVQRVGTQCRFCGKSHSPQQFCPAWNRSCSYCGKRGHFQSVCFDKPSSSGGTPGGSAGIVPKRVFPVNIKRSHDQQIPTHAKPNAKYPRNTPGNKPFHRQLHAIEDSSVDEEQIEFVEMVWSANERDELLWAEVGGVLIEMQIDSGVQSNIIDDNTWDMMIRNGVQTVGELQRADRKFKAYAQKDCLEVPHMFEAEIVIHDKHNELKTMARFYVVKDGPQPLLGKRTAMQLGVLIVGLPSQHESLHSVKVVQPFPSVRGIKIHLPVDKSVPPVAQRLRRLPFATLERVDVKLDELLAKDVIEKVSEPSRWVSPMVIVMKDSGDIRLCIDMRQVNKAILRETHPLPTIEDIRWKLNGAIYFSRLDIREAFHQLELDDESKPITTFITHKGLYRYKRLVFGISCAPEMFQKVIEQILADCGCSVNFIDDIIVFGKTEREHDESLEKVLSKMREYGILLNHEKCAFKLNEIDFLGHHFDGNGMIPAHSKVEAIKNFREPVNAEEVRSFLGLVNYVGAFIPNLASISFPLRELTKNKSIFKWGTDERKAFEQLTNLISNVETLSHFDPKLKTRVVADASPVGLGAVLLQFHNSEPRVVTYASKSLTETERRYAQTEKEALALVWAVERFQIYLIGIRFELETDHKPLEVIFSPESTPCLRIERWVLRLQAFSYDVVYRKGKSNIADPLSRLSRATETESFDPDSDVYIRSVVELAAVDIGELERASTKDSELCELREFLDRGVWNYTSEIIKPYHFLRNELGKVGDLVIRGSRLIIPKCLRQRMVQLAHEGHPGRTKMQQRLRNTCWWPGMDEAILRVVDSCEGCRVVSQPDRPEPMARRQLPESPWIDVAIDFLGPLPSGDYLLVIIDYFSRYKEVEILRKITASETADRLEKIFVRLGYPRTITLDNGRQFVSREFEEYCRNRGIVLNKTTPYWPQENGLVERQNRSLIKRLKISQALKQDWKQDLMIYLSMYYSTPHSTTGKTPSELMFGRNIRTKLPSLQDLATAVLPTDYRDRDQATKEKGMEAENYRRKAKVSEIKVGDKVLMKNLLPGNKLTPTYDPAVLTVTDKQGPRVTVQNTVTNKFYDRNSSHLKRLPLHGECSESGVEVVDGARSGEDSERMESQVVESEQVEQAHEPVVSESNPDTQRGRSQRVIRRPVRFEDCVTDFES